MMSDLKLLPNAVVILAAFVSAMLLFDVAHAGTKRACLLTVLGHGDSWGQTKRAAKDAARSAWQQEARRAYGPEWAGWENAKAAKVKCQNCGEPHFYRCGGRLHGYACRTEAKPCKLVRSGERCKPFAVSAISRAPTERMAKDAVHRAWEREAAAQSKSLADHLSHLAVHGVLHLLGYDHEHPREADRMERMEAKILACLGIADPYAVAPQDSCMDAAALSEGAS